MDFTSCYGPATWQNPRFCLPAKCHGKESNCLARPELLDTDGDSIVAVTGATPSVTPCDFEVAISIHQPREIRQNVIRVHARLSAHLEKLVVYT